MTRCPYCGEPQFDNHTSTRYRCGTTSKQQSAFCKYQVDPDNSPKAKRPRKPKPAKPDRYPGKHDGTRAVVFALQVGQTVVLAESAGKAKRVCALMQAKMPGRLVFRTHPDGCEVSLLGRLDGIEVGESRLYTDVLRHAMTLIYGRYLEWQRTGEGPLFSFDIVEGFVWIRRVR